MSAEDARFVRRAVFRLSTIEFWERYAFYTMFSLLALFVAAPVAQGGMGWSDGDSLRFFGVYLLTVQIAPLVGGYVADRWLRRSSLKLGGLALLIGHFLLAMPNFIAWAAERSTGQSLRQLLTERSTPLGSLTAPEWLPESLSLPYLAISLCFYGSVILVALGNGLFKPVLTVVVGRFPHPDEGERNAAFTTFFLWLNAGGLLSTLLGGWLAERYGWGWAFVASAAGMAVSIATMFLLEKTYINPFLGDSPLKREDGQQSGIVAPERFTRPALIAMASLMTFFMIACIFSYQSYGFVGLFTADLVDREVGGFTIPPGWFIAINPLTIMALSPLIARVWRRQRSGGWWTPSLQFALAFVVLGLAFGLLAAAAAEADAGALASPLWVAGAIMLIAVSELLTSPIMNSTITRLTPRARQALAIGVLSGAAGLGAGLSGRVGAIVMESDKMVSLMIMAGVTLVIAVLIAALSGRLRRLTV